MITCEARSLAGRPLKRYRNPPQTRKPDIPAPREQHLVLAISAPRRRGSTLVAIFSCSPSGTISRRCARRERWIESEARRASRLLLLPRYLRRPALSTSRCTVADGVGASLPGLEFDDDKMLGQSHVSLRERGPQGLAASLFQYSGVRRLR
ncbi:hypothetical protein PLICRDRAFT_568816 [Plicaturopsis crispa FD-325 SS-3]|nr:hypothetical protein PLICRDRAFT_568816 [Plicaturopsis crispa FD-325 SS-3]